MAVIEPKGSHASSWGSNAFYFIGGCVITGLFAFLLSAAGPSAQGAVINTSQSAAVALGQPPSCEFAACLRESGRAVCDGCSSDALLNQRLLPLPLLMPLPSGRCRRPGCGAL